MNKVEEVKMIEVEKKFLVPKSFLTRMLEHTDILEIFEITQYYLPDEIIDGELYESRIRQSISSRGEVWKKTLKSKELGARHEVETVLDKDEAWKLVSAEDEFFMENKGAQAILKKKRYTFQYLSGVTADEFDRVLNGNLLVEVEKVVAEGDSNINPVDYCPEWFKKLLFDKGIDVTEDERLYGRNLAIEI